MFCVVKGCFPLGALGNCDHNATLCVPRGLLERSAARVVEISRSERSLFCSISLRRSTYHGCDSRVPMKNLCAQVI